MGFELKPSKRRRRNSYITLLMKMWMYEIETGRPLFCNRDGTPVSTLTEVERKRRTGYKWYVGEPQRVLEEYPSWRKL